MRAQAPYEVHYQYLDKPGRGNLEFRELNPSRCHNLAKAVEKAKELTVMSDRPFKAEVHEVKTGRIKFRQTTDGLGNVKPEAFV